MENNSNKKRYILNFSKAFFSGGLIAIIGQLILNFYLYFLDFDSSTSSSLMIVSLIFIAAVLTATGIYDKLSYYALSGSLIPITGFANTMTSAAMEYRNEGIFIGIANNMFKLAGSVIVFGVVSAYVFGSIRFFIGV